MSEEQRAEVQDFFAVTSMIPYYDNLSGEEKREVTESIRLLLRQTFLLERKYDRRTERFQNTREYRICGKHLEFIREYLAISGIMVQENSQMGVIYIQGETQMGEKLPRLATLYILILKLIYDEKMETVSTSVNVYTTLGEVQEKLGSYRLLKKQPSPTDIRRAIALLKKYQLVEPLDLMEDLKAGSRLVVYPCINLVLLGDDVRRLLSACAGDEAPEREGDEETEENEETMTEGDEETETEENKETDGDEESKKEMDVWEGGAADAAGRTEE